MVVEAGEASRAFATAYQRREDCFLSHANVGNVRAYLRDFAGYVAPRNVRKRDRHVGQAAAHPKVKVIQGASLHPHQDLVGTESGLRCVFVPKHVRTAMLMENYGLHETSASAAKSER